MYEALGVVRDRNKVVKFEVLHRWGCIDQDCEKVQVLRDIDHGGYRLSHPSDSPRKGVTLPSCHTLFGRFDQQPSGTKNRIETVTDRYPGVRSKR